MRSIPQELKDPSYGQGSLRRHIRIKCDGHGGVLGALEDDCHALSVSMTHDSEHVTQVSADWERYPTTTCPGSLSVINAMVGCPVVDDLVTVKRFTASLEQCTHIHDLTAMMIIHAFRHQNQQAAAEILYEAQVNDPDPETGVQSLFLFENGRQVLSWSMKDRAVIAPEVFQGLTPMKGFIVWAVRHLDKETLIHAFILQMAFFVSTSRVIDFSKLVGVQAQTAGHPANACYASREERMPESFKVDHKRYFHEAPEQLLKFVDF